jgi:CRP-like cAMP-binding protein
MGGLPDRLLANIRAAAALLSPSPASAEATALTDTQAWLCVVDAVANRPQEWSGAESVRELLKEPVRLPVC